MNCCQVVRMSTADGLPFPKCKGDGVVTTCFTRIDINADQGGLGSVVVSSQ